MKNMMSSNQSRNWRSFFSLAFSQERKNWGGWLLRRRRNCSFLPTQPDFFDECSNLPPGALCVLRRIFSQPKSFGISFDTKIICKSFLVPPRFFFFKPLLSPSNFSPGSRYVMENAESGTLTMCPIEHKRKIHVLGHAFSICPLCPLPPLLLPGNELAINRAHYFISPVRERGTTTSYL